MKTTLQRLDVYSFLSWRFSIATLLLIALRPSALRKIDFRFLKKGLLIGFFLGSGYVFQSLGLTKTTVGKTGFITGLYVVFTPLVAYAVLKKKINKKLNVLSKVADNLDELIGLCREPVSRFAKNAYEVPYNVSVGDHVFIPAFGYWRKGKILATSGAKFIVGYVTPSNTFDLKYKSVCLADLRIEKVTP